MSGEDTAFGIASVLCLVLALTALAGTRLPLPTLGKMVLGWVGIFALLAVLVGQRERLRPLWDGAVGAVSGNEQRTSGTTVRIPMATDGHFYANARINGVAIRLLIDSGATTTALSVADARAAGVAVDTDDGAALQTANGRVVASRGRIDTLAVGSIATTDLGVLVAPEFGDTSLLGMNFLSRLASWRVEGRVLILDAEPI